MRAAFIAMFLIACNGDTTDDIQDDDATDTDGTDPLSTQCGDELTCGDAQYCHVFSGGAEPSVDHTCKDLPSECEATPTCACLLDSGETCTDCTETDTTLRCDVAAP